MLGYGRGLFSFSFQNSAGQLRNGTKTSISVDGLDWDSNQVTPVVLIITTSYLLISVDC